MVDKRFPVPVLVSLGPPCEVQESRVWKALHNWLVRLGCSHKSVHTSEEGPASNNYPQSEGEFAHYGGKFAMGN